MFVYLSIPAVIIILWIFGIRYNLKKDSILRFGMMYLFLISSLRAPDLGADATRYNRAFEVIGERGTYYMEKGYVLLNRIVASFTSNYSVLIFIINIVFFLSLYYYIKNFVKEKYWIYCLMVVAFQPYIFLQTTFNIMRQCCAVGLIVLAMNFYVNSIRFKHRFTGYILYNLIIILAAQFHRSAYFLLVIPIIFIIKMNKNRWRLLALVFISFNYIGLSRMMSRIESLTGNTNYTNYSESMLNNPLYLVLVLAFLFWITSYYDKLQLDKWERNFYDLYSFSIAFLLFAVSNDMVYRIYIVLAIISLPAIQVVIENDESTRIVISKRLNSRGVGLLTLIICAYYICFFVGYILLLYKNHNSAYIPYHTLFWKE